MNERMKSCIHKLINKLIHSFICESVNTSPGSRRPALGTTLISDSWGGEKEKSRGPLEPGWLRCSVATEPSPRAVALKRTMWWDSSRGGRTPRPRHARGKSLGGKAEK